MEVVSISTRTLLGLGRTGETDGDLMECGIGGSECDCLSTRGCESSEDSLVTQGGLPQLGARLGLCLVPRRISFADGCECAFVVVDVDGKLDMGCIHDILGLCGL